MVNQSLFTKLLPHLGAREMPLAQANGDGFEKLGFKLGSRGRKTQVGEQ
jgi:hypothetical protein